MTDSSAHPVADGSALGGAHAAEARTRAFLAALERKDVAELERSLHPQATLTIALSLTGAPEAAGHFAGKAEVLGYLRGITEGMDRIAFTDVRVSATAAGDTTFVQTTGAFTTADGRPYNNVYVMRLDWREGLLAHVDEYGNPVTYTSVFGEPAA
ncbi:nuclear transport factor 2 family protein [Streptomonospora litoralis]|uniref:SnoaL-like domain protein n=1 Tax=Streptomonospora litoralis TaxID=2498135 RepID=A0A4P6Q7X6_9ACTN|nr:nuclear transport factor 2 family protein [Streptomonospora litoralis]QBI56510.1 SnoaL-like domain protein [Streptomonospora litoralis]